MLLFFCTLDRLTHKTLGAKSLCPSISSMSLHEHSTLIRSLLPSSLIKSHFDGIYSIIESNHGLHWVTAVRHFFFFNFSFFFYKRLPFILLPPHSRARLYLYLHSTNVFLLSDYSILRRLVFSSFSNWSRAVL